MFSLSVNEKAELLEFLLTRLQDKSRNKIKSFLKHEQILVNGKAVTQFNHILLPGDVVSFYKEGSANIQSFPGIRIVYEDESIILIDKKSGLLSVATEKDEKETAYKLVSDYVKRENPSNKIFVLHRLDRDASGLLMFARNKAVQEKMQSNWQEVVFERIYAVLVEGQVEKEEDTIHSWLKENKNLVMYSSSIPEDGEEAITHYRVLRRGRNYSLLDVELETGRKNQIRIHMKDLGHPIVGDLKYGAQSNPIKRLALHARKIGFYHPEDGRNMHFDSPIPPSFLEFFRR